jgi:MoxR-like ATPase
VDELLAAQTAVRGIHVAPPVKAYIVELTTQTRRHADVYLGASPRGSLALFRTAQARAAIQGRDYILPDDVKALADSALSHRIIIGPAARIRNVDSRAIVKDVLGSAPVPGATQLSRK